MKKLWDLVSFLAVVNLLALLAVTGWLWTSGRLDVERLRDVRDLLAMTLEEEAALDAESGAAEDQTAGDGADLARRNNPPLSSTDQVRVFNAIYTQNRQAKSRLADEAKLLRDAQDRRSAELDEREEAIVARETAWKDGNAGVIQTRADVQFGKTVALYNQFAGKHAKQLLIELVDQGQIDQAVTYLNAMEPRAVAKTLKEMKSDAENILAADLLERLRTLGIEPEAPGITGNDIGPSARN